MKSTVTLHNKKFEVYLSKEQIDSANKSLAEQINTDFKGKRPLVLSILNGAFIFAADLVRYFDFPLNIEFVRYASYEGTGSTGVVKKIVGLNSSIEGRDIIILEDIIDTGLTLTKALEDLRLQNPASISIATLLFKPEALQHELDITYVGFEISNEFVVGYGLDYDELGRDLPDIYKICE